MIYSPIRSPIRTAVWPVMRKPAGSVWSPSSWFSSGEQGLWYDPSDLSTMFQDSAGTTPVTAVEQPVGLILDRRLGALSALGANVVTNGDFASNVTGWSMNASTLSWVSGAAQVVTAAGSGGAWQDVAVTAGRSYRIEGSWSGGNATIRVYNGGGFSPQLSQTTEASSATGFRCIATATSSTIRVYLRNSDTGTITFDNISVREIPGNHATQATSTARPTLRNRYNLLLNSATLSTQNVTTVATGYQLRFSGAGSITLSGTATGAYNAGTHSITCTAGTLTLTVSGSVTSADLLFSTDSARPYQSITTATSYDSDAAKFPLYLAFDGSDDSLATGSVNFSGTDTMTVVAGVTKLSDSAQGMVAELTASAAANAGSFALTAPDGASATFGAYSRGSAAVVGVSASANAAPRKTVVSMTANIVGDSLALRVAGASAATSATDQGTGNYSNAVVYFGRRGGTTLPFNGRLHQLIIRGAASADIALAEGFTAGKVGITL